MLVWQMFISSLKWKSKDPTAHTIPDAEVDLILVGATGLNAFEPLLVGSSSEYILRHAKVDLLVVREQEKLCNHEEKGAQRSFCLLFILTSTSPCRIYVTDFVSSIYNLKTVFEQPATSFLVCSLIFIEYYFSLYGVHKP